MIYLDNAATTALLPCVKEQIVDLLDEYGNPSSSYQFGKNAKWKVEQAREIIANLINAEPNEIFFTSGGSESNTWALNQFDYCSSPIEHHSIPIKNPPRVDNEGRVIISDIDTTKEIFSCMYVNNEIGTIQDVEEISRFCHKHGMLFHVDAVQALPHLKVDVKKIGCDMLSGSAHKFGGMKGVGFLYIKNGTGIKNLIHGGKQEQSLRPGTENVIGIATMATALDYTYSNFNYRNCMNLTNKWYMFYDFFKSIPGCRYNSPLHGSIQSTINIQIDDVKASKLVSRCDMFKVCISSGSACNEGIEAPSHVLKAIGLSDEEALNSIRISFSLNNTEEEIRQALNIMKFGVSSIRNEKE